MRTLILSSGLLAAALMAAPHAAFAQAQEKAYCLESPTGARNCTYDSWSSASRCKAAARSAADALRTRHDRARPAPAAACNPTCSPRVAAAASSCHPPDDNRSFFGSTTSERDDFSSNRHPAPAYCSGTIEAVVRCPNGPIPDMRKFHANHDRFVHAGGSSTARRAHDRSRADAHGGCPHLPQECVGVDELRLPHHGLLRAGQAGRHSRPVPRQVSAGWNNRCRRSNVAAAEPASVARAVACWSVRLWRVPAERSKSAFTRVFDALCARAGTQGPRTVASQYRAIARRRRA